MNNAPQDDVATDWDSSLFVNVINTLGQFLSQTVFDFVRYESVREGRRMQIFLACIRLLPRTALSTRILITLALVLFPWQCFARRSGPFYLVSLSLNNSRALKRLEEIIHRQLGMTMAVNSATIPLPERLRIGARHPNRNQIVKLLTDRGHQDSIIFMNQIIGTTCALLFLDDLQRSRPRMIGVANDHSPVTVALLETGKALGIPRFYVQHAPVTGYFPPLSVEMTMLDDWYSVQQYFEAAHKAGRTQPDESSIFLLPQRRILKQAPDIDLTGRALRVCIVLSLYPDMKELSHLCRELAALPNVADIILKPHPRYRKTLTRFARRRNLTLAAADLPPDQVIEGADLFIVSNSGMSWELVQSCKPVLFADQLDFLHRDYFGLLAAGLTPKFSLDYLQHPERLQAFFGPEWRARLQEMNPRPPLTNTELEERIAERFAKLLLPRKTSGHRP